MPCASEEKKQLWKDHILNQRKSGLSIAKWCSLNKIQDYHFYYWQSKLFPKAPLKRSSFTEIEPNDQPIESGIVLEFREFTIHISHRFDSLTLKQCIEVLKKC